MIAGGCAILALCAAVATLLAPPVNAAPDYGAGSVATARPQTARDGTHIAPRIAQSAQAATSRGSDSRGTEGRSPALRGRPGDQVPLAHALVDMAASSGNYVIVNKAPAWMTLSPAESIGSGVWLIAPNQLSTARVELSQAARGEHEVSIAVVGPGGAPIAEAKLMVMAVATPVAAAAPTPAAPQSAVASIATTALTAVAATPAAAAATPPHATPPAPVPQATVAPLPAPPAAKVAQNTAAPPAAAPKDGTKAWTEFLGGAKPAAKPGPGTRAPAAAQKAATSAKSEAELLGYAKHLVRECTTCHSLYGQDIGIPLMVGLAKDRFLDTMELYRIGKRDNVAMASVAQALTEEETLALAIYLGRIKPPPQAASVTRSAIATEAAGGAASAGLGFVAPSERLGADSKEQARVDRWLKRGQQMLDQGEISQARLLLTRAAELGDPRAALMLATSYDPNALPWRPGMGPEAEPARAKELYQLAIRLGAGSEAERRLQELP